MGEVHGTQARVSFNGSIRISGGGERLSSMGGVLLLRELDERLGVTRRLGSTLVDPRRQGQVTWSLESQLRARLYALAAGYGAQRDVAALSSDPVLRLCSSERRGVGPLKEALMSQPTLARLQRLLGLDANLRTLERSVFELGVAAIRAAGAAKGAHTLDVDSMPVMSHGQQPGSVWNDYYRGRCFHPLMALHGETGTMLGAELRPGNASSAKGVRRFLLEKIEAFELALGPVGCVRGDSSFASGAVLNALEKRGTAYVFRLRNNPRLTKMAEPYLVTPEGERPAQPREWLHSLWYSSRRWKERRRVILVVQETPGELYLHHFFLVTSDKHSPAETILEHYRQRGTSEARFGSSRVASSRSSRAPRSRMRSTKSHGEPTRAPSSCTCWPTDCCTPFAGSRGTSSPRMEPACPSSPECSAGSSMSRCVSPPARAECTRTSPTAPTSSGPGP